MGASSKNETVFASINVTPFVDVVLVLLVIFMITAPVVMKDTLGVKLPKSDLSDKQKVDTLGVAVTESGAFLLNGSTVTEFDLERQIIEAKEKNPNIQAIIAADENALHKYTVKAINIIKKAGVERFAIQVERL